MPPPVEAVQLLALQTRVRGYRVAAGALSAKRLHDVRAFKSAYAELGYLRRLAGAGRHGGTVVTSMRQLVAGLARIHPAWDVRGDGFDGRDRHHQAVRRRLRDLEAMGLIRWRVGVDLDGEERRTEIELLTAPPVDVEELRAAVAVLARWQARYGQALNTGSHTGIRNAAGHGRPLTASERQRRGCEHTRQATASRRVRRDKSNSAPPSGASASLRNNTSVSSKAELETNASLRTGVTRAHERATRQASAAPERTLDHKTAGSEESAPAATGQLGSPNAPDSPGEAPRGIPWDPDALIARVKARVRERAPVIEAIARQANTRAIEVAGWSLDRGWPRWRLREAWVVARHGATAAADSGPAGAGPLDDELYVRLRRAIARYERNAAGRPDGYPTGGLAALLHLGTLAAAGQLADPPRLLGYAIGRLDQLSKRMRAHATANSARRQEAAAARAGRRRAEPESDRFRFRQAPWPPWMLLPGYTQPSFSADGRLLLNDQLVDAGRVPAPSTDAYRLTVRDAYLLADRPLPIDLDGRRVMALRDLGELDRAGRPERPSLDELELRELAHRTGEPISLLRRTSPVWRRAWLERQRQTDAATTRAEAAALRAQLSNIHPLAPPDGAQPA